MNINAIYDLNACLKASILAGANFINEDIRLNKAVDNIDTIKQESPIFAKISKQCHALLDVELEKKTDYLFDTITLLDAVLTTLDTALIKEDVVEIENDETYADEISLDNVPYNILNEAVRAFSIINSNMSLEKLCAGNYDILKNYRIFKSFINFLGRAYGVLYTESFDYIVKNDDTDIFIKLIKKDIENQEEKVKEKRMDLIVEKEGAKANDLYLELIPKSKVIFRLQLIEALRFSEDNIDYLISTCSGKRKRDSQAAAKALSYLSSEKIDRYVEDIANTNPRKAITIIKKKDTENVARIISNIFNNDLNTLLEEIRKDNDQISRIIVSKLFDNVEEDCSAMYGKKSLIYFECFITYLKNIEELIAFVKDRGWYHYDEDYCKRIVWWEIKSYLDYCYTDEIIKNDMLLLYNKTNQKFLLPIISICKVIDGSFTKEWIENEVNDLSKKEKNEICARFRDECHTYFAGDEKGKIAFIYYKNRNERVSNLDIPINEIVNYIYQSELKLVCDLHSELMFIYNIQDYYYTINKDNKEQFDIMEKELIKLYDFSKKHRRLYDNSELFILMKKFNLDTKEMVINIYRTGAFEYFLESVKNLNCTNDKIKEDIGAIKNYIKKRENNDKNKLKRIDTIYEEIMQEKKDN